MKNFFESKINVLKIEMVESLKNKDLIGKDLYIRDEVSNLTGGLVDGVVSAMSAHCEIIKQKGELITCEMEFDEVVEVKLSNLSVELLLILMED